MFLYSVNPSVISSRTILKLHLFIVNVFCILDVIVHTRQSFITSSLTFLNFPCSSKTFCSTFATFSSRTFLVNSIHFFKSFISRSFPISCFVITSFFSIIFYICCCCFANSSSKSIFMSSTILSLSSAVFPLGFF